MFSNQLMHQLVAMAKDALQCPHQNANKLAQKQKQLFDNIEKLTKQF